MEHRTGPENQAPLGRTVGSGLSPAGISGAIRSLPPRSLSREEIQERALASYLGLAVGDALGATTEFMLPREIEATYGVHRDMVGGGWLHLKPGSVTDDTEMSLALGEALLEAGGFDLRTVGRHFVQWMRSGPADIGATVRRGLRRVLLTERLEADYAEDAAGNGAAMRNVPVIIATLASHFSFHDWSIAQARLTHHHPESDAGTLILGDLTRRAILQGQAAPLQSVVSRWVDHYPPFDYKRYRGEANGYIIYTVRIVLHHFFSTSDFESCLIGIVNQGGDADTNGALAGMLAGAFYGREAIPERWIRRLNPKVKERIGRQVRGLLEMFLPLEIDDL